MSEERIVHRYTFGDVRPRCTAAVMAGRRPCLRPSVQVEAFPGEAEPRPVCGAHTGAAIGRRERLEGFPRSAAIRIAAARVVREYRGVPLVLPIGLAGALAALERLMEGPAKPGTSDTPGGEIAP